MERQTFAQRVSQARRELGVARHEDVAPSDLARMVGVSPKTVYSWERGANLPSRAIMEHLARVLTVTPAWLEFGQEPKHPPAPVHDPADDIAAFEQVAEAGRQIEERERRASERSAAKRVAGARPITPRLPGKGKR